MKIRLVGNPEEFAKLSPHLEKKRHLFDSWRKPQKGNNPKYEGNPQLLQYLEIDVETFLELLKK